MFTFQIMYTMFQFISIQVEKYIGKKEQTI